MQTLTGSEPDYYILHLNVHDDKILTNKFTNVKGRPRASKHVI